MCPQPRLPAGGSLGTPSCGILAGLDCHVPNNVLAWGFRVFYCWGRIPWMACVWDRSEGCLGQEVLLPWLPQHSHNVIKSPSRLISLLRMSGHQCRGMRTTVWGQMRTTSLVGLLPRTQHISTFPPWWWNLFAKSMPGKVQKSLCPCHLRYAHGSCISKWCSRKNTRLVLV